LLEHGSTRVSDSSWALSQDSALGTFLHALLPCWGMRHVRLQASSVLTRWSWRVSTLERVWCVLGQLSVRLAT